MNKESLKNLHGKMSSGYLSDKSKRLIENTVFNYLYAQRHFEKEENNFTEQSTYENSPPKAPTQKAQLGVSVRKCNRSMKSENPEEN